MRVRDTVSVGQPLSVTFEAVPDGGDNKRASVAVPLTVAEPGSGDVDADELDPHEVQMSAEPGGVLSVSPGRKEWVHFHITIPPEKTTPIQVSDHVKHDRSERTFRLVVRLFFFFFLIAKSQKLVAVGVKDRKYCSKGF